MKQQSKNRGSRALSRTIRTPTRHPKSSVRGFVALVQTIAKTHSHFMARASLAINVGLTLRNWSIGCHIREFEQRGAERATYGAGLFEKLSACLQRDKGIKTIRASSAAVGSSTTRIRRSGGHCPPNLGSC